MGSQERKGPREFNRANFEAATHNEALTVSQILEMHAKGQIRDDDYVFTLEGVKEIAYTTYRGAWNNCRKQKNVKTDWTRHVGVKDAKRMILEAFTT